MLSVLFQSLAVAALGIISPGSITAVTLLLMSDRGWRNGVSFLMGYIVMYATIGTGVLVLGVNSIEGNDSPQSVTTSIVLMALGLLLLLVGARNWRNKPGENPENGRSSRFIKLLDSATPIKSFAFAATVAVINLKNLTIFLSAVSVLLLSNLLLTTKLTMLIPLILVFCTSVIIPVVIYFAFPDQANQYLTHIKNTIDRYSRPLGIALSIILGVLLFYRGISGLL